MAHENLIDEKEIDATGGSMIQKSIHASEPLLDLRIKQPKVNYILFDRYKVGFLEDENHKVLGISSIEIRKDFYDIDQLPEDDYYWDEEAYYK
jgi:hypothetical protein